MGQLQFSGVAISGLPSVLAQIFCSIRRLVEDFLLDVQQKFSTRRPVEIFYQMSSSRKIATYQMSTRKSKYLLDVQQQKKSSARRPVEFLLDVQQNFYQTSSRPDDLGQCLNSHYILYLPYVLWNLAKKCNYFQERSIQILSKSKVLKALIEEEKC